MVVLLLLPYKGVDALDEIVGFVRVLFLLTDVDVVIMEKSGDSTG